MNPQLVSWLTAAMLAWVPPQHGKEGPEAQRYADLARNVLTVAYDPIERPLIEGAKGRSKTALLIASIMGFESAYRTDVQSGEKRGKAGDACYMQVIVPKGKRIRLLFDFAARKDTYEWIPYGAPQEESAWTTEDLVGLNHVDNCIRTGVHIARESFHICHDLSLYTSGLCNSDIKAKHREQRAKQHFKMHPAPVTDEEVQRSASCADGGPCGAAG